MINVLNVFVVPGNGPALLRMPDIKLLNIVRVMCETIDNKTNDRKFDVQIRHAAENQNCSTNRSLQTKLDANDSSRDEKNCSTNRDLQTKTDADNASGDKTHI